VASAKRPNVIVLMADDHRGDELGHLPRSGVATPALDALAARGVSFAGAHCQGSMIRAVCVPSRASLMTGRNIFASSANPTGSEFLSSIVIPPELETFPQALRGAGYETYAVGKWHNDTATFNRSFSGGAALMFLGMSDHYDVPVRAYNPAGEYPGANSYDFDSPRPDVAIPDGAIQKVEGFSSDIFADAAIDFLNRDHDAPFLLYVAFTAPHDPRTPPPGWEIDPDSIELPPNVLPQHPFDNGELEVRDELLAGMPRTEAEIRQHIADYYGMIAHLYHSVGRILAALDASGLTDDTVVIYTGDHGLAVGQHGLMGKQNLYQHSLRIPLVLAGPGVPEGEIAQGLVWHGDTTATIRALCGLDPDPHAEGAPLVDGAGQVATPRREHGAAYEYGQRAFRDERYKLIRYWPVPEDAPKPGTTPGCDMVQLFDLERDPWELTNLAEDPAHGEIRRRLEAGLRDWQRSVDDELLKVLGEGRERAVAP
jgi:arylsulfatase A-like enzyme